MNELFLQILEQTGYYCIPLFLGIFIIAFLQRDFFVPFFKVKSSRGKLVLIFVHAINRNYCKVGKIEENFLVYDHGKKGLFNRPDTKRLNIPPDVVVFYRFLNITCCEVSESENAIKTVDYKAVTGFDAIKFDNLYTRALYRPSLQEDVTKQLLIFIIVVCILVVIVGIMEFMLFKKLDGITTLINQIKTPPPAVI